MEVTLEIRDAVARFIGERSRSVFWRINVELSGEDLVPDGMLCSVQYNVPEKTLTVHLPEQWPSYRDLNAVGTAAIISKYIRRHIRFFLREYVSSNSTVPMKHAALELLNSAGNICFWSLNPPHRRLQV